MTCASEAVDFNQTLDVEGYFSSEVTFYSYAELLYSITDLSFVIIGKILDSGVGVYTGLCQNVVSCLSADSVNVCETDLNTLFFRQVDTCLLYTSPSPRDTR